MNDYFGGRSKEDLEQLARRLISQAAEGHKVDFKQTLGFDSAPEKAELAKDVSSIANTDDEAHLDDWGYIVFGVSGGQLTGHVTALEKDADKLQAQLTDLLKGFLAPVPSFSLVTFDDKDLGRWGMIVIPPSARQPHIFIRDGAGVVKHEWWVRINDTKERAGVIDYARIMSTATRRAVLPLERQLQRLTLQVEQRQPFDLVELVAAIRGDQEERLSPPPAEDPAHGGLVHRVRSLLTRGKNRVEDDLLTEALRVSQAAFTTSDRNPALFNGNTRLRAINALTYLEEQALPLALSFANIARYDATGELTAALCRAIRVMARLPQASGHHYTAISQFRLYPLALCLYAVVIIAANEQREDLLRSVFALEFEDERNDRSYPLIVSLRRLREAHDVFSAAFEERYYEPISVRVQEVLVPQLLGLLAGTPTTDAFYVAEFVLALAHLRVSGGLHGKRPLPGSYLYKHEAGSVLRRFLLRRPDWLEKALGAPLAALLKDFDETAGKVIQDGWSDGFDSGAVEAYERKKGT